jgi:hypothetical protein
VKLKRLRNTLSGRKESRHERALVIKYQPSTLQERGFLVPQGRRGTVLCSRPPVPITSPIQTQDGVIRCTAGNPDPRLVPALDSVKIIPTWCNWS